MPSVWILPWVMLYCCALVIVHVRVYVCVRVCVLTCDSGHFVSLLLKADALDQVSGWSDQQGAINLRLRALLQQHQTEMAYIRS